MYIHLYQCKMDYNKLLKSVHCPDLDKAWCLGDNDTLNQVFESFMLRVSCKTPLQSLELFYSMSMFER